DSRDVTNSTTWRTSNVCAVSVSTTTLGTVTAVGTGASVTITATYNGVSDTVTATVPSGLTITPCGTFNSGSSQTFTAKDGSTDVTASSTWTSDHNDIVKFSSGSVATFGPNKGTAIITASGSNSGELQVTVQ